MKNPLKKIVSREALAKIVQDLKRRGSTIITTNGSFDLLHMGHVTMLQEAKSLGDEAFIFYLQALKRAGFRVILMPNPMHPNLDMGKGYEWDEPDSAAGYHRSYELIRKLDSVVIKWARIAEEYKADGFAPLNEPYKLVRDYRDAAKWLQQILPQIKKVYTGKVIAVDTMYIFLPGIAGKLISVIICISALGAVNGLIFTGARISYAMGSEHRSFRGLGKWSPRFSTPVSALIIQGCLKSPYN